MDSHVKDECCYVKCELCGSKEFRRSLQAHKDDFCPESEVQCMYSSIGCDVKKKRKHMREHERQCAYREHLQRCPLCNGVFTAIDLQLHHYLKECRMERVRCECGHECVRRDLQRHQEEECLEAAVKCEFAELGCQVQLKRRDAEQHANEAGSMHALLAMRALDAQRAMLNSINVEMEQSESQHRAEVDSIQAQHRGGMDRLQAEHANLLAGLTRNIARNSEQEMADIEARLKRLEEIGRR